MSLGDLTPAEFKAPLTRTAGRPGEDERPLGAILQ